MLQKLKIITTDFLTYLLNLSFINNYFHRHRKLQYFIIKYNIMSFATKGSTFSTLEIFSNKLISQLGKEI